MLYDGSMPARRKARLSLRSENHQSWQSPPPDHPVLTPAAARNAKALGRRQVPVSGRHLHAGHAGLGREPIGRREGHGLKCVRLIGPQRARPGEPHLPPKAGDRPRPRARQAGRVNDPGTEPEPAPRARLAQAQPEHAATREVCRVALQSATPDQADRTCLAVSTNRQIGVPELTHRAREVRPKSRNCRRNRRNRSRMNRRTGKRPRQGPWRTNQPWSQAACM